MNETYETINKKLNDLVNEYTALIALLDAGVKKLENNYLSGKQVDNGVLLECKTKCNTAVDELKVLITACNNEMTKPTNVEEKSGEVSE